MKFRVEVICLHEGGEQRCNVLEMDRTELALETLGLSVAEGKAMLHGVQDFVATQQGIEDLERKRACAACGQRRHSKEVGTYTVKTVFGPVEVPNPPVESLRLPERRTANVSSRGCVAARGAEQSGVALSGDEVGLTDSVREGGGPVEGSVASGRDNQS